MWRSMGWDRVAFCGRGRSSLLAQQKRWRRVQEVGRSVFAARHL
jgi:hypothetical protein